MLTLLRSRGGEKTRHTGREEAAEKNHQNAPALAALRIRNDALAHSRGDAQQDYCGDEHALEPGEAHDRVGSHGEAEQQDGIAASSDKEE